MTSVMSGASWTLIDPKVGAAMVKLSKAAIDMAT